MEWFIIAANKNSIAVLNKTDTVSPGLSLLVVVRCSVSLIANVTICIACCAHTATMCDIYRSRNFCWSVVEVQHAWCPVRRKSISRVPDDHRESVPTGSASERLHIYGWAGNYDCGQKWGCTEDISGKYSYWFVLHSAYLCTVLAMEILFVCPYLGCHRVTELTAAILIPYERV